MDKIQITEEQALDMLDSVVLKRINNIKTIIDKEWTMKAFTNEGYIKKSKLEEAREEYSRMCCLKYMDTNNLFKDVTNLNKLYEEAIEEIKNDT